MIDYQRPASVDPWERLCWILIAVGYGYILAGWIVLKYVAGDAALVLLLFLIVSLALAGVAFCVGLKAKGQMRRLDYLRTSLVIFMAILPVFLFRR